MKSESETWDLNPQSEIRNMTLESKISLKNWDYEAYFGLKFNQGKCVALSINSGTAPKFANGERVHQSSSTIYLGACINDRDDPRQDVNLRLGACFALLNKLDFFWRKSNCSTKFKLNVFDAVIRSKLVYGLEAVQLTPSLMKKLDAIQFKGLRKILNIKHSFLNRANTNVSILQRANQHKNPNCLPNKNIRTFSQYVNEKQEALLKHTVRTLSNDPMREAMLVHNSPLPRVTDKRRVGRPKNLWAHECYKRVWMKSGMGSELQFDSNRDACIHQVAASLHARSV